MAGSLQESSSKDQGEWVTIAEYTSLHEAGIAKGRLESVGIPSVLENEKMVGMFWHLSNAVGGIRVKVSPSDVQEARALLVENIATSEDQDTEAAELEKENHPEEPIKTEREDLVHKAFISSIFGFFIPLFFHLWALLLLARASFSKDRLDRRHKIQFAVAVTLSLLGLTIFVLLWSHIKHH